MTTDNTNSYLTVKSVVIKATSRNISFPVSTEKEMDPEIKLTKRIFKTKHQTNSQHSQTSQ